MTIEDVSELRRQEKAGTLRKPDCFKDNMTMVERSVLRQKVIIATALYNLTRKRGTVQNFSPKSLINRSIIRRSFLIKSFKGLGTNKRPYKIDGELGRGNIINAHEFFTSKKYPEFIEKGFCFGNCFTMAQVLANSKKESKIVSGIMSNGNYSFLHSVLEVDKFIIDFNIDMAISKELYNNIFLFEPLVVLEGKQIHKDKEFLENNLPAIGDMSVMYMNFAYDDVISYMKDKKRQEQKIELEQ